MPTDIKLKNSVTATNAPTSLQQGEVAINITDKKVWVGNAATTPVQLLGAGASGTFGALTVTSLTDSGNLTFTGTGNRILGDFSNATIASRVAFQTSTVNGSTSVAVLPNGTGLSASLQTFNNSDPTNAGRLYINAANSSANIVSDITGTGTYLPLTMYTGGSERVRIDTSGNVGIGTSSPSNALQISKASGNAIFRLTDTTSSVDTYFISDSVGTTIAQTSALPMLFKTFNAERMRIDSSGNVGIGTSSPANKLHIKSNDNTQATGIASFYSNNGTAALLIGFDRINGTNSTPANASLDLGVSSVPQAVRIDSSGNLLVGTTTTRDAKIVSAGASANYSFRSDAANTAGIYYHMTFNPAGGTQAGFISSTTTLTTYSTASDYRLKENIVPMTGALARVSALKPVTYQWKVDGSAGEGFIAHELQVVVPECVTGEKDAVDAEGKPVYQGIDTSLLVATLTAAIQEQQALITNLTNRLTALENK
jgi:hypothetical protein